eukprot:COSAG02_NODE_2099_length_9830_cov_18.294523_3_plen_249_part_00
MFDVFCLRRTGARRRSQLLRLRQCHTPAGPASAAGGEAALAPAQREGMLPLLLRWGCAESWWAADGGRSALCRSRRCADGTNAGPRRRWTSGALANMLESGLQQCRDSGACGASISLAQRIVIGISDHNFVLPFPCPPAAHARSWGQCLRQALSRGGSACCRSHRFAQTPRPRQELKRAAPIIGVSLSDPANIIVDRAPAVAVAWYSRCDPCNLATSYRRRVARAAGGRAVALGLQVYVNLGKVCHPR